jgi:hypothetical protein
MTELPFDALRTSGLLWLINATVFHPRGFALYLALGEDGGVTGWGLQGNGTEPWQFDESVAKDRFATVEALFAQQRGRQQQPNG